MRRMRLFCMLLIIAGFMALLSSFEVLPSSMAVAPANAEATQTPRTRRHTKRPTMPPPTVAHVEFSSLMAELKASTLPSTFTNNPRPVSTTKRRRGILFIKIPKTGGTVISDMLQIYSNETGMHVALPMAVMGKKSLATCDGSEDAKRVDWASFLRQQSRKLEVFASHACMNEFMRDHRAWINDRRPLALTMLRSPWNQFISKYRYTRYCCEAGHWSWCLQLCQKLHQPLRIVAFAESACAANNNMKCNIQRKYLGYLGYQNPGSASSLIDQYDLVLILERIEESLVLLHFLYDVPFHILIHVKTNVNNESPYPDVPNGFHTEFLKTQANLDTYVYKNAYDALSQKISKLPPDQALLFPRAVELLKTLNRLASQECSTQCATNSLEHQSVQCLKRCLKEFQHMVKTASGGAVASVGERD